MTILTVTGHRLQFSRGTCLRHAAEALRRAGWRLTTDARGRLIADRLH